MLQSRDVYASPERQTFSKRFRSVLFSNAATDSCSKNPSPADDAARASYYDHSASAKKYKFVFSLLKSSAKKDRGDRRGASAQTSTATTLLREQRYADVHISPFWIPSAATLLENYSEAAFEHGLEALLAAPAARPRLSLADFVSARRRERLFHKLISQLVSL